MKIKLIFISFMLVLVSSCSMMGTNETSDSKISKADLFYNQGTSELLAKEYTSALEHLLSAKELDPKNSKIRNNLGMAYYFKNEVASAITELKESISLDSKNSDARNNLASVYYQTGKLAEAKREYIEVSKDLIYKNQFRTYYNLALVSIKEKKLNDAIAFLKKSIKEKDDYCPAHFKLGELANDNYQYQDALKYFKNAMMGECTKEPAPHFEYAKTLVHLQRYDEAIVKFEEIREKFSKTRYAFLALQEVKSLQEEMKTSTARNENNEAQSPEF